MSENYNENNTNGNFDNGAANNQQGYNNQNFNNQNYNNQNYNNQNYNNMNGNNGFNNGYKRLYKSKTNRILGGVCGGIGEYFNIDPTLIRIGAVVLGFTGAGIIAYIIAAICMPESM